MILLSILDPNTVPEYHYFLETLNNPVAIAVIRGVAALVLLFFIVSYFKYRKK